MNALTAAGHGALRPLVVHVYGHLLLWFQDGHGWFHNGNDWELISTGERSFGGRLLTPAEVTSVVAAHGRPEVAS